MKNNHNGEFEVKVEGELQTAVESQSQSSSNIQSPKSGGNAPSDLGAINKSAAPNSASNSAARSNLDRPSLTSRDNNNNVGASNNSISKTNNGQNIQRKQVNNSAKKTSHGQRNKNKQVTTTNKNNKANLGPNNKLNPLLNQNKMKNFGKNNAVQVPKVNSSAPFLEGKGKSGLKSKLPLPKLGLGSLGGGASKKTTSSLLKKTVGKKANFNIFAIFKALPIQVKVAIIGFAGAFCIIIILILVLAADFSSADGNREMKDQFIKGDLTEEELCEYLDKNNYLITENGEVIECEDHPAYKFFVNFKELMEEYETKYERNRFQVNVELLYETLAYYNADEEFYDKVTKEEIKNLIDAMIEEVEESCVIKIYDKKTKKCSSKTKYVYTLYEFSLNKYISYLKYGTTSTHPNYGNDPDNKSTNGKAVTRICGEGKNVDYVFGFGLVNTSSSPLTESSDCPGEPVTAEDYEKLPDKKTTLEELNAYGGVPYYETIYKE